jgi:hypothetical protein
VFPAILRGFIRIPIKIHRIVLSRRPKEQSISGRVGQAIESGGAGRGKDKREAEARNQKVEMRKAKRDFIAHKNVSDGATVSHSNLQSVHPRRFQSREFELNLVHVGAAS